MLPALARAFGTTVGGAARVVTAASVAYGVFQFLFGPLGDHLGKYRVITWACLGSTVGAFACALSHDLDVLTIARAVNGASTAAVIPLSMAWIGDAVPYERRQAILARFLSGQVLGLLGGQVVGGFFSDHFGWRWGFAVLGLIYLTVGSLLLASLSRRAHLRPDAGAGGSQSGSQRILSVLANGNARFVLGIVFAEAVGVFGSLAFIPAYLHLRFGLSLFNAGLIVATFGLGGLSYTLWARHWVRVLGPGGLAGIGGLLLGAAFLSLVLSPAWGWAVLACGAAGLGFYQIHNTLQTLATQMTPEARGTAVSLFASCYFIGQAAGVALAAAAVDRFGPQSLFLVSAGLMPVIGGLVHQRLKSPS